MKVNIDREQLHYMLNNVAEILTKRSQLKEALKHLNKHQVCVVDAYVEIIRDALDHIYDTVSDAAHL